MRIIKITNYFFVLSFFLTLFCSTYVNAMEEDRGGVRQFTLEEFETVLRNADLGVLVGKVDAEMFSDLYRQAGGLVNADVASELVGKVFNDVANEYFDHDYVSGGESFRMLTDREMQVKYANWQKWYIYKLFATHYSKSVLSEEDQRLCNKGLTATEFVTPLETPSREDIQANAERFYGQQIKIKKVLDQIFKKMGIAAISFD